MYILIQHYILRLRFLYAYWNFSSGKKMWKATRESFSLWIFYCLLLRLHNKTVFWFFVIENVNFERWMWLNLRHCIHRYIKYISIKYRKSKRKEIILYKYKSVKFSREKYAITWLFAMNNSNESNVCFLIVLFIHGGNIFVCLYNCTYVDRKIKMQKSDLRALLANPITSDIYCLNFLRARNVFSIMALLNFCSSVRYWANAMCNTVALQLQFVLLYTQRK